MQRIAIVGTTGSGKSTLALKAAEKLGCGFIELDALFWKPNWVQEEKAIFRQKVSEALSGESWTVGGNYSIARDIIWRRADTLVWLDYPFPLVIARLLRRTLRRVITQEALWSGNRETWRNSFVSKDNLFLFALKTHFRRRRELPVELQREEYQHLKLFHFTKPGEAETWLQGLRSCLESHCCWVESCQVGQSRIELPIVQTRISSIVSQPDSSFGVTFTFKTASKGTLERLDCIPTPEHGNEELWIEPNHI